MDQEKTYYEAYEDRYRQVHALGLQWAGDAPSPIVSQVMARFGIRPEDPILEVGCGEGRDALPLLDQGYSLLATDISPEAVAWCRSKDPRFSGSFQVLDCLKDHLDRRFRFIYAVAVLHMLVLDQDRAGFYRFLRDHLDGDGIALVCSMGDGVWETRSDITQAFFLQPRVHSQTGRSLRIAGTSCRVVSQAVFLAEIEGNGLSILDQGHTCVEPDFPQMLYAVVRPKR